jgi:hypothetical protein
MLYHDDLMDFAFGNASVVYVFLPHQLLAPSSPLYKKLFTFLLNGGLVISAYTVLDYLPPASICILDKLRQAFLYSSASCATAVVQDPLTEYKERNAPLVVPFGAPPDADEEEAGDKTYVEILDRYGAQD